MTTQTTTTEEANKEDKVNCGLNNKNSLIPAIQESEDFIKFLIKRFDIQSTQPFIVVINKASKNALGTFANIKTEQHFTNTTEELNTITLNTLHIKKCNPYEVLAHELAHYINFCEGVKGCSSNQYHNKHFKREAERLLLTTEKGKKGYYTKDNEVFNKMVEEEFKSKPEVFNVFQNQRESKKVGSRLKLYICACGVKVRVASEEFQAKCLRCEGDFIRVEDD